MTRSVFWLSEEAWLAMEHLPNNQPGARRVDDQTLIGSG